MTKKVAKIYGTVRLSGEKRYVRKGHYYTSRRNKAGRFESTRKWSPQKPNFPETKQYREMYAHEVDLERLKGEIEKTQASYEWVKYEDLCYDEIKKKWVPCAHLLKGKE